MRTWQALLGGLVVAATAMKWFFAPYCWAFAAFAAVFVRLACSSRKGWRIFWANGGIVCMILLAVEGALFVSPRLARQKGPGFVFEGSYAEAYFIPDPDLGYATAPSRRHTTRKRVNGELVYDVSYTIDDNGWRVCPPSAARDSVLFFGCSFTFGEGVGDEETMPYRVGQATGDALRVFNFGFHGYGPHQMLAALESGRVEAAIGECRPVWIVYQALPSHVSRAAGLATWGAGGPQYILSPEGAVRRAADSRSKRDPYVRTVAWFRWQMQKSAIGRRVLAYRRPGGEADVALTAAIMGAARDEAVARWPDVRFAVLLWEGDPEVVAQLVERARLLGLDIRPFSSELPELAARSAVFTIAHDGHPNALAHERVAAYVLHEVLQAGARP